MTPGAGDGGSYGRSVTERIALFPLGHVLMPGAALPLHIFEPRYQAMIADLTARSTPPAFGVLSIHRGIETSENVAFAAVGTMAEIVNRRPYPDGTSDLLTIGSRRFRGAGGPALGPAVPARRSGRGSRRTVGAVTPGLVAAARAMFERYVEVFRTVSGKRSTSRSRLSRCRSATSWPGSFGSPARTGRTCSPRRRPPSVTRRAGADAARDHFASADP